MSERADVVGCFLFHQGRFVLLLRHPHKSEGGTWGLPGGKIETGETEVQAIIREVTEETGYAAQPSELVHLGAHPFVSSKGKRFVYSSYRLELTAAHSITLEPAAHAASLWVTPLECDERDDLIPGLHELLRLVGLVPKSAGDA
jgi:8-oxo-dGTP pyrophosphatase MutT (NUDIX family)